MNKACCDRNRIVNRTEKEQKNGVFISDLLENALVISPKTDVLYTV